MTNFDPTKPVQTRDGRKARILCTDVAGQFPIVAVITTDADKETVETFRSNGRYNVRDEHEHGYDLFNTPEAIPAFKMKIGDLARICDRWAEKSIKGRTMLRTYEGRWPSPTESKGPTRCNDC